jgi:hypothetical protein
MRSRALLPAAATVVVVAASALAAARISIDHDIAHLLPDTDPALVQGAKALRSFLERTVVDVGSEDGSHSLELLGEVADRFAAELVASGTVLRARARLGVEDALELVDFVRERAPLFTPASAWPAIEARLEHEAVLSAVETLERRIQEPDGAVLARHAGSDPLGLAGFALAPLASIAAGPPGARLVDGRLASAGEDHVLVLVEPGFPASDLARTEEFLAAFDRIAADLAREPAYRGVALHQVGAHRSSKDNERQIRRDLKLTMSFGAGLILAITYLCFGRLRLVVLAQLPALVGGVITLGVFSLFQGSIAAPILGFGTVLIGLTIDYAVHVLTGLRKEHGPGLPELAMFLGALTTSVACLLLRGSALPGIREVGLFGSIGVLVAAAFAILVLPSLRPLLGQPGRPLVDLERLVARAPRPRRAAWIALGATPLLALGAARLEFDGDVRNLSSLSPAAAADEQLVRRVWGSAEVSTLLVEAPGLQAALEANDELAAWLERARADGLVEGHASIAGILPSLRTQEERARRWRAFWTAERRQALAGSLHDAAERTHFRSDAFAPFLAALEGTPGRLEPADVQGGPAAALVGDRLVQDGERWRVLTPVFTSGTEQLARLGERLRAEQPEVAVVNKKALMRQVAALVSGELAGLGLLAFAVVAAIVFVWLGEPLLTGVIVLPLALGLLWTLGILGWAGEKLNLVNAVFVVFLFGVAIDYSIYVATGYLQRFRTGVDRTAEMRASVLLCALTTCAGFGTMALAGHPVLHSIGMIAGVGIASATLAAQVFVPVCCQALLRSRLPDAPLSEEELRGPGWHRLVARLYRHRGAFVQHYAASKARRDPLVFALPELCPGTGRILVVGCGYGIMTARLAMAFPAREIVALDPDERKLAVARAALDGRAAVRFLAEDVRAYADPAPCEWVLLVDVLHYWDEAAQGEILRSVHGRMGPGSRLVFRDGCAGAGTGNRIVHAAEALARATGFTRMSGRMLFHTEDGWRRLLSACGFRVESSHPELGLLSNLVLVCSRSNDP